MTSAQWRVAGLLFGSGLCALVYQTVWLREFRLIFGASTFATAAVLAIFMGGLGVGSALLGRRADSRAHPLAWYGTLEIGIALSAAASPVLLWGVSKIYFALGGSVSMGVGLATIVRLLLATLVLAVPTVLMGGTLPAAARAVETSDDAGRRGVSLLYGINTLGAVAGAVLSTFWMLETFGNRQTLLMAVLVNLLVAMAARAMSRTLPIDEPTDATPPASAAEPAVAPRFVYAAAAIAGFAFLLMELVWYRMLSPILGGTTFMFGLILAVALLGIGLGGAAYALLRRGPATVGGFALTCAAEALAIAIPFALGDRLALLAKFLAPLVITGFSGSVVAWTLITFIVVLPAAFIAGVQFPLLISLLGRGRENVGREIGAAYAWNTAGAIAGSLAGGFGLMPLLTAPGCWQLVTFLLSALGGVATMLALRERQRAFAAIAVAAALGAVLASSATGPTAVWRHSGIGAGRTPPLRQRNELQQWMHGHRHMVGWEAEGRESSIALLYLEDIALMVNGKSDGSARGDAGTQIMGGLIGAILHPQPKTALVIGLGTGSTSGWLAAVPAMERVDVVELEAAVVEAAHLFEAVNARAMRNPKMHTIIADGREVLLASPKRYDIIFSEPSNPYRAGIASLYTREFYESSARRLNDGGVFLQWVQMYAIDAATMRTIYATLGTVFPHIDTFRTTGGDAVLAASKQPIVYDVDRIRRRLAEEPYRSAMAHTWRTSSAEGFLARLTANDRFARMAADDAIDLNTDDRPVIEFGFARALGADTEAMVPLATTSAELGTLRPTNLRGNVNWAVVEEIRGAIEGQGADDRVFDTGELARLAMRQAEVNDPRAAGAIAALRNHQRTEADAIEARWLMRQQKPEEAARALRRSFLAFRTDPWPLPVVMEQALGTSLELLAHDVRVAPMLADAVSKPFAAMQQEQLRRHARVVTTHAAYGCGAPTLALLREMEPWPLWERTMLELRARCYVGAGDVRANEAVEELRELLNGEPRPVVRRRAPAASPGSSSDPR